MVLSKQKAKGHHFLFWRVYDVGVTQTA